MGLWRNGERIGLLPRKVRVRIPTDPPECDPGYLLHCVHDSGLSRMKASNRAGIYFASIV